MGVALQPVLGVRLVLGVPCLRGDRRLPVGRMGQVDHWLPGDHRFQGDRGDLVDPTHRERKINNKFSCRERVVMVIEKDGAGDSLLLR